MAKNGLGEGGGRVKKWAKGKEVSEVESIVQAGPPFVRQGKRGGGKEARKSKREEGVVGGSNPFVPSSCVTRRRMRWRRRLGLPLSLSPSFVFVVSVVGSSSSSVVGFSRRTWN